MSGQLETLRERLGRLADLGFATSLAGWDQQTKMPPRGAEARASVMATMTELAHREFIDAETGRLIEGARAELSGADPDDDDVRMLALVHRQWEKARRVPAALAAELAHAASTGQEAWVAARAQSDFAAFVPHLRRNVELASRYVDCHRGHDGFATGYDVLLDDYEPGMGSATVTELFTQLRSELVPLIERIGRAEPVNDAPLAAHFPLDGLRALCREAVGLMGFSDAGWRLDDTVHPFAVRVGPGDVRLTSRFEADHWPSALFGSMHECGHGLYEDGIDPRYARTPLGSLESLALHESQSRLWENMVGRGAPFCAVLAPRMRALGGGEGGPLADLDPDTLYRAVNRTRATPIRVDADEATYSLHIIVRFELEQALLDGTLDAADAAQAWRERYADYLGIEITDDADGVLQDVHWSAGLLGYFPTYALGNLIAGQLWERARAELPTLDEALAAGELSGLREWLREHVHRFGSKYPTTELLRRELGAPIAVAPFVRYLKEKLGDVYGLDLDASPIQATHESE